MRITLALCFALVAAVVPTAAFGGAQPDLLDGLYRDVALLPAVRPGTSLTAKLDVAQAAIDRGQACTAIRQLNAFGRELNGRFGNTGIGNPGLLTGINGELERVVAVLQVPGPPDNPGVFCATAGVVIG
jgi:hypothetical protein